jgi:hypothetical protein
LKQPLAKRPSDQFLEGDLLTTNSWPKTGFRYQQVAKNRPNPLFAAAGTNSCVRLNSLAIERLTLLMMFEVGLSQGILPGSYCSRHYAPQSPASARRRNREKTMREQAAKMRLWQ